MFKYLNLLINILEDAGISDGVALILTIVEVLVAAGLTYLMIIFSLKEIKKIREESSVIVDGLLTKQALFSIVTSHITKFGRDMPFPLFYIDLDGFGQFVEAFGEKQADKVLERIANNILQVLPTSARVTNYTGDKFLIFVNSLGIDRTLVLETATKIKEAISKPIKIYDQDEIRPIGSIAIAFYPVHGENIRLLEDSLKITMYNIKKAGGNSIRIFSQDLKQDTESVDYYYQIKRAIHNKEFQLYYQPIVDSTNMELFGFQTLIRWNHPEFGVLTPDKFLNIMDQSGDIDFIGLWGLEELVKTYHELVQEFSKHEMVFTMNLSPRQLMNPNLPSEYQKILRKYKMEASKIAFEVPQFTLFDKREGVGETVRKFKELGFKISVDGVELDFSVLGKPEATGINLIKFDRNFLNEEETYMKIHLLDLIKEFAGKNNCALIQEQIEDVDMVAKAHKYGFTIMQGWYFSKPVPTEQLRDLVANKKYIPKNVEELKNLETTETVTSANFEEKVEENN